MAELDPDVIQTYLAGYYRRIFPSEAIIDWLSYYGDPLVDDGACSYLSRREFAFILRDDVYLRYKSFTSASEFASSIVSNPPHKIDIGAVFTGPPKDRRGTEGFEAMERELVFDIDLTDYDDIRTCCSGGSVCRKCWKLIVIAARVIESALKEDFGYKHLLWVFSGRRGIHCWVCDKEARTLTSVERGALADYFTVVVGGRDKSKKVNIYSKKNFLPKILLRSFHMITGMESDRQTATKSRPLTSLLAEIIEEQKWFDDETQRQKIIALALDPEVRDTIKEVLEMDDSVCRRYSLLYQLFTSKNDDINAARTSSDKWLLHEFTLQYFYPRIDVNVTKGLNHLLKSPFCVHPKTGKVSVPLDLEKIAQFDPTTAPTIRQLMDEATASREQENDDNNTGEESSIKKAAKGSDFVDRTSLAPFVDYFKRFIDTMAPKEGKARAKMLAAKRKLRQQQHQQSAAFSCDTELF